MALMAFIVGYNLGAMVRGLTQIMAFRKIMQELGITDQQLRDLARKEGIDAPESQLPQVEVVLEKVNDQIFAYRKDTQQFLAQAPDTDSLIARLNETMTPCRVVVSKEDGSDLLLKRHS